MSDTLIIFTDGSYRKKYNYCGYGVHFPNQELKSYGGLFKLEPLTNQRAELYAILSAFKRVKKILKNNGNIKVINIFSDSNYSINCLTNWCKIWKKNNWINSKGESVANQEIIKPILFIISNIENKGITVNFYHIYSHTNNKDYNSLNNEIADKLANLHYTKYIKEKENKNNSD